MRATYKRPSLEILIFDEHEVLVDSIHVNGVTAAEDLQAQYNKLLGGAGGSRGSVTTVRLEDIKTR